ncbi:MAG: S8 family serine peptidase, partial [Chthoniobacterales bacterium]
SAYQWHLPKVSAPSAWDTTTGSSAVTVAVVDSGVQANHPDLVGRVLAGYDFVNNDSDPADDNGHGTAVAGVAAAKGNDGIGVAGAAWNVAILPVKTMNSSGSGSYSAIANGITYSADRGAKIINLSLGGTLSSSTLQNAVSYAWNKGSLLVAAAGNNGSSTTVYPAAYPNVVAVSATTSADTLASFSSYGSFVDLSAPGQDITTTWIGSSYVTISGTSFSSPLTAGVAALALSRNPALSNAQISSLLTGNTDDLGAVGYDTFFGSGRLNAAKVVSAAPSVDTTAPVTAVTNPKNGSSIAGLRSVSVSVASSDNIAVTKAELYINGRLNASSSSGNFTFSWNTSRLSSGTYQLQSRAYDAAGN